MTRSRSPRKLRDAEQEFAPMGSVVFIEPFFGGSHAQLVRLLRASIGNRKTFLCTLPAKKWHWRLHCSALHFSKTAPRVKPNGDHTLFASSMLNLADFLSLRPDYLPAKKILYFHENQLAYPSRQHDETKRLGRDFHYGFAQILSCLAADVCLWNSKFNLNSFLARVETHLKFLPAQQRLKRGELAKQIAEKSKILYFPVEIPVQHLYGTQVLNPDSMKPLHILWNHRWEHDKRPDLFFKAIDSLHSSGANFHLSILGESFGEVPVDFELAKSKYANHILNFGFVETRDDYFRILSVADICVSCADHEFFGVSVMEATMCGCFPLVPKRFPQRLRREKNNAIEKLNVERYFWENLKHEYHSHFQQVRQRRYTREEHTGCLMLNRLSVAFAFIILLIASVFSVIGLSTVISNQESIGSIFHALWRCQTKDNKG